MAESPDCIYVHIEPLSNPYSAEKSNMEKAMCITSFGGERTRAGGYQARLNTRLETKQDNCSINGASRYFTLLCRDYQNSFEDAPEHSALLFASKLELHRARVQSA